MELFYSQDIQNDIVVFSAEESKHMIKVLRHNIHDNINVVDGRGSLFHCSIIDANPHSVRAQINSSQPNWNKRSYNLTMAVAPTKNNDRFENFVEKACEIGVDTIVPVISQHSQRRVYKRERAEKIALSAMKQSLKASLPVVTDAVDFNDFISKYKDTSAIKLIAHCMDSDKHSIVELLRDNKQDSYIILIGPEGDFNEKELNLALDAGFKPVHLGTSRLRTETAAILAVTSVYLANID